MITNGLISVIALAVIVNTLAFSMIEIPQFQDIPPTIYLDTIKYKINKISELKSADFEENEKRINSEIKQIDLVFDTMQTGNYPDVTESILVPSELTHKFNTTYDSWKNYKSELQLNVVKKIDEPQNNKFINYVLDKNIDLVFLSDEAIKEISMLDTKYNRHKELILEIQSDLKDINSSIKQISRGNSEGMYDMINENRVHVEANIRKLMQYPLYNLDLEKYSIEIEELEQIPSNNAGALNQLEFVWESVQLRLVTIESDFTSTKDTQHYPKSLNEYEGHLVSSLEDISNSWYWSNVSNTLQTQPIFLIVIGTDASILTIGIILGVLLLRQRKIVIPKAEIVEIKSKQSKSTRDVIVELLKKKPLDNRQLYEEILKINTSVQRVTMRGRLSEMRRDGILDQDEHGLWKLIKKSSKPLKVEKQILKEKEPIKKIEPEVKAEMVEPQAPQVTFAEMVEPEVEAEVVEPKPKVEAEVVEPEPEVEAEVVEPKSALYQEGISQLMVGKYDEAIDCFNKVLEELPNNADTLYQRSIALSRLDRHNEALEGYDKVLKIKPKHVDALYNKGIVLSIKGKHSEAISHYDLVLENDQSHIDSIINKGLSLEILWQTDDAVKCYDKVLKINPNNIDALKYKASLLQSQNKFEEALSYYDEILKNDPKNGDAFYNKARVKALELDHVESLRLLRKAIEINSDYWQTAKDEPAFKKIITDVKI